MFFFESSEEHIKRSSFYKEFDIPLISDSSKSIYAKYGIESSVMKGVSSMLQAGAFGKLKAGKALMTPGKQEKHVDNNTIPADFLINERLLIKSAYYGKNFQDHISIPEIMDFIEA